MSYTLGLYRGFFYLPKDHFLKFWWKNVQNWWIWKIEFFETTKFQYSKFKKIKVFLPHSCSNVSYILGYHGLDSIFMITLISGKKLGGVIIWDTLYLLWKNFDFCLSNYDLILIHMKWYTYWIFINKKSFPTGLNFEENLFPPNSRGGG